MFIHSNSAAFWARRATTGPRIDPTWGELGKRTISAVHPLAFKIV